MPIQRLTGVAALVSMLLLATPSHAAAHPAQKKHVQHRHTPAHHSHSRHAKSSHPQSRAVASASADSHYSLVTGGILASPLSLNPLPALSPMPTLASSGVVGFGAGTTPAFGVKHSLLAPVVAAPAVAEAAGAAASQVDSDVDTVTDLRKALIALAMNLRDVRYVRGGHSPATGFDCSGFVHYVFAHAIGVQLPSNSASQFLAGLKVKRADMKPGDLVFFHTGGRRHRVTHVGIYISNGNFIHAPTYGKSVQISSLDEAYWAKRFVGAKRPEGMLALAGNG
ncbi:C40 family peptidase [Rhodanobacter geophilus]|uniref:C40 family peptidase n=1 Tax=Rhodanobacter geophilus TaxID=3162488 RepID=A0ABV3QMQ0_9GAMM